jgi:hypothetical protein
MSVSTTLQTPPNPIRLAPSPHVLGATSAGFRTRSRPERRERRVSASAHDRDDLFASRISRLTVRWPDDVRLRHSGLAEEQWCLVPLHHSATDRRASSAQERRLNVHDSRTVGIDGGDRRRFLGSLAGEQHVPPRLCERCCVRRHCASVNSTSAAVEALDVASRPLPPVADTA